jgi:hypothetical protein
MLLKYVYTLFVGILLAVFAGVGIAAFYPEPKYPEPPFSMKYPRPVMAPDRESTPSADQIREQEEYDKKTMDHQKKIEEYNKNVSSISVAAAVLMLIVSLTLFKQILVIADGLLLGGVLTLLYSIARGFQSGDHMFRFLVVTVGLIVALILGYLKFVRPNKSSK